MEFRLIRAEMAGIVGLGEAPAAGEDRRSGRKMCMLGRISSENAIFERK